MTPQSLGCLRHLPYATEEEANTEVSKFARKCLLKDADPSWKLLRVFSCGDHWHIGRAWPVLETIHGEGARQYEAN